MKLPSDRFANSDLSYADWSNKMVAENKMYRPNVTSFSIKTPQATYTLSGIACGFIGASNPLYVEGEQRFCNSLQAYGSAILLEAAYLLKDGLCEDNVDCTMLIAISTIVAGAFVSDGIANVCTQIFDELYNNCNAATGGSGQLTIEDSEGQQTGTVEADFYANDEGATCPANTDTAVCTAALF